MPQQNLVTKPAFAASSRVETTAAVAPLVYSPAHFRASQGQVPSLAAIPTGQLLVDATLYTNEHLQQTSSLVDSALTEAVRAQHRRHLREFREWLLARPVMVPRPLEETAAYFMQEVGFNRKWQWQTLHRSLCSLVGAMSNAPLYCNLPHPVHLNSVAPHFRAALSSANQLAQQSQPHGQVAVGLEHITVAVEEEPRLWARVALLLMWLSSARVGCVLQLRVEDLRLETNGNLQLHFAHGKGVRLRGPYTVGCKVTGEWRTLIETYLAERRSAAAPSDLLFPATEECPLPRRITRLLSSIRVAHPAMNLRAMRRGSLQTVASSAEAPIKSVMERAGHTSDRTTRRYLDFGRRDVEAHREGARITAPLLPSWQ